MFDTIFEKRNKSLNTVLKAGSFLGRALRENIELFKYNSETKQAHYVTESGKIIVGTVSTDKIKDVEIIEIKSYLDESSFNTIVESHINKWLGNLYRDQYVQAEQDFANTLDLWSERLKLDKVYKALSSKSTSLSENKDILKTLPFKKLQEIAPSLVKFLKENKDKLSKIPEIRNSVVLSNTIANAFGIPRLNYKKLTEAKEFHFNNDESNKSIFDLITKQELIKKELLESKRDFESIWIDNSHIVKLAECITGTEKDIQKALAETIINIPYFALVSKTQLTEMFNTIINVSEEIVPLKEIQKYSTYIFEAKKPVKNEVIKILDEQYGINIQNLKDPVSYRSLLNTQIVTLETIKRTLPKDSVNRTVIKEAIELLKVKNGVEAIDVNTFIVNLFTEAGYNLVKESVMNRYLDFDSIANDLSNVANVLKMIRGAAGGAGGMAGGAGPAMGGVGGAPMAGQNPAPMQPPMGQNPQVAAQAGSPEEDLNGAPLSPEDAEEGVQGGLDGQQALGGMEAPPTELPKDNLTALMAELEELIGGLKIELGEDPSGMEPGMEGEMPPEGLGGEEGLEGEPDGDEEGGPEINIDTGEGDDEVHVDAPEGDHDVEGEEEYEDEMPPKKEKGKPSKPDKKEKKESKPQPKKGKE
jgi:hypothetical protein